MIARRATAIAASSYSANLALGLGVASGAVRTGRARWAHHALYIVTAATTTAAAAALLVEHGARGAVMAPALAPIAAIPFAGTHTGRHPALALSIAPFLLAGLAVAWGPRRTRTMDAVESARTSRRAARTPRKDRR